MKVKYITTTNKHFFDVSLPLDDEMKIKAWHYTNTEEMNILLFPLDLYAFLHISVFCKKTVTKPSPKPINLISNNSS